jgi:hypothetical protein
MQYFAPTPVGETRHLTPEGFLLCLNVPIGRTGRMVYQAANLPGLQTTSDGSIQVNRSEEDLFDPIAVASFNGKAITNDHPPIGGLLSPKTYKQYSLGSVLNCRRGEGEDSDCLVADLLVQDERLIEAILDDSKTQVSAGYDAKYEPEDVKGFYRQLSILGNHVAFVALGRCGPRCAVGDAAEEEPMPVPECQCGTKPGVEVMSVRARLLKTIDDAIGQEMEGLNSPPKTIPAAEEKKESTDLGNGGGDTHIHVHLSGEKASDDGAGMEGTDPSLDPDDAAGGDPADGDEGADTDGTPGSAQILAAVNEIKTSLESVLSRLDALEGNGGDDEGDDDDSVDPEDEETGATVADSKTKDARLTMKPGRSPIPVKKTKDTRTKDDGDLENAEKTVAAETMEPGKSPIPGASLDSARFTRDSMGKTRHRNSKHLELELRDTMSRGHILAPDVSYPTFDAAQTATATMGNLCGYRRSVLKDALKQHAGKAMVTPYFSDVATLDSATCDTVRAAFIGATDTMARSNNRVISSISAASMSHPTGSAKGPLTPAQINERNEKRWAR